MEQKSDFLIRYNPTAGACTLEINKLNDKNKGSYSCSVMIPYPDDAGFLKIDSNSTALSTSQKNDHIYQIVLGVIAAIVMLICIIVCPIVCYTFSTMKKKYNIAKNELRQKQQPNTQEKVAIPIYEAADQGDEPCNDRVELIEN